MNVEEFFQRIELSEYLEIIAENEIDFPTLLTLSNDDFKDLGIDKLGHRKKILNEIAKVNSPADSLPTVETAAPTSLSSSSLVSGTTGTVKALNAGEIKHYLQNSKCKFDVLTDDSWISDLTEEELCAVYQRANLDMKLQIVHSVPTSAAIVTQVERESPHLFPESGSWPKEAHALITKAQQAAKQENCLPHSVEKLILKDPLLQVRIEFSKRFGVSKEAVVLLAKDFEEYRIYGGPDGEYSNDYFETCAEHVARVNCFKGFFPIECYHSIFAKEHTGAVNRVLRILYNSEACPKEIRDWIRKSDLAYPNFSQHSSEITAPFPFNHDWSPHKRPGPQQARGAFSGWNFVALSGDSAKISNWTRGPRYIETVEGLEVLITHSGNKDDGLTKGVVCKDGAMTNVYVGQWDQNINNGDRESVLNLICEDYRIAAKPELLEYVTQFFLDVQSDTVKIQHHLDTQQINLAYNSFLNNSQVPDHLKEKLLEDQKNENAYLSRRQKVNFVLRYALYVAAGFKGHEFVQSHPDGDGAVAVFLALMAAGCVAVLGDLWKALFNFLYDILVGTISKSQKK